MGRTTSKGNDMKSKMKHPSDMPPRRDSNLGGNDLWSNTLPLDHGGEMIMSRRQCIIFAFGADDTHLVVKSC